MTKKERMKKPMRRFLRPGNNSDAMINTTTEDVPAAGDCQRMTDCMNELNVAVYSVRIPKC